MNKNNSSSHKWSTIINYIVSLLFSIFNLQYDMERQLFSSSFVEFIKEVAGFFSNC